jgi:hypothetical protein
MVENLIGKKFGKLLVLKRFFKRKLIKNKPKVIYWKCRCDCGKIRVVGRGQLTRKDTPTTNCGCSIYLPPGEAAKHCVYAFYKIGAKRRNYSFKLSLEDFHKITQKNCFYCGSKPKQEKQTSIRGGKYLYNGIDRINNKKGYTKSNSVPCCSVCNKAKSTLSLNEFKKHIKHIYNNLFC